MSTVVPTPYLWALSVRAWQHLGGPLRAIAARYPTQHPAELVAALRRAAAPLGLDQNGPLPGVTDQPSPAVDPAPGIRAMGRPGLLAESADRSAFPVGAAGTWAQAPALTHPLQPDAALQLIGQPVSDDPWDILAIELGRVASLTRSGPGGEAGRLERVCLALWRGQRALCAAIGGAYGEHAPADPHLPDHAAWSTARIAAAVAMLDHHPESAKPVLARVSLHGVQPYIAEARKARDLWTACMVFGELTWAAMGPIIDHCGPEAILYPDLRGNALMDQLLLARGEDWVGATLPPAVRATGSGTRAVPVPNTFAALLPAHIPTREGELTAEALLERCAAAAQGRWEELRTTALGAVPLGGGTWQAIYHRSTKQGPAVSWTLSPWEHLLHDLGPRPDDLQALPGWQAGLTPSQRSHQERRDHHLQALVGPEAWDEHDHLFYAAWGHAPDLLRAERGFDYPLQHARLLALHEATGRARLDPAPPEEPGEKCTLTGRHEALHNGPGVGSRAAAKALWQSAGVDDNGAVSERLGGPGTLKRYLADAKGPLGLSPRWQGVGNPMRASDGAPFPSTAGVAATPWLRVLWELLQKVGQGPSGLGVPLAAHDLRYLEGRVGRLAGAAKVAFKEGELQTAIHPWALHALHSKDDPTVRALVGLEAQRWSISAQQAIADRLTPGDQRDKVNALITEHLVPFFSELRKAKRAVAEAREAQNKATGQRTPPGSLELLLQQVAEGPGEHCAILAMDGDGISKLVSGDPGALRARWRDTLHPSVVKAIEGNAAEASPAVATARGLLDHPRAMSPALHGTLTRALADLTDRIAPWVIEVEFNGRLLYAGGDDLLAMLPADEALPAAARIQQLFSAAWLIDTTPNSTAWDRRAEITRPDAQARFVVLDHKRVEPSGLRLVAGAELPVEAHCCPLQGNTTPSTAEGADGPLLRWSPDAQLFPMVGRAHSLSAGIAYGHFKEPLRDLIATARDNLELRAKPATKARTKSAGGGGGWMGHVAISRLTGGDKATAVLPWGEREGDLGVASAPTVASNLTALQTAIASGQVSSRLPYAMRERLRAVLSATNLPPADSPGPIESRARANESGKVLAKQLQTVRMERRVWIGGALAAEGLTGDLLRAATWLLTEADTAGPPRPEPDHLLAPLLIARHLAGAGGAE